MDDEPSAVSPSDHSWRPSPGLLVTSEGGRLFLLPRRAPAPLSLDERGSEIWSALEERGFDDAAAWLAERDHAPREVVEAGLREFLVTLAGLAAVDRRA